jgi:hypothetical protein
MIEQEFANQLPQQAEQLLDICYGSWKIQQRKHATGLRRRNFSESTCVPLNTCSNHMRRRLTFTKR